MLRPLRPLHCDHTMPRIGWLLPGLLLALCLLGGLTATSWGQPPQPAAGATTPDFDWKGALPKFRPADRPLAGARAESGQLPAEGADRRLLLGVENVGLPVMYGGQNQNQRFLAIQVILANLTANPLTIARKDVELVVDGQSQPPQDAPQQFQNQAFQVGQQGVALQTAQMPAEVSIPSNSAVRTWMLFCDLPPGGQIPRLELKIRAGGQTEQLDLQEFTRQRLGLEVQRLGPRKALGRVVLKGDLDMLGLGVLADELDRLASERVVRVVLVFQPPARIYDYQLFNWLQEAANPMGRNQGREDQFPPIPTVLRELHLVNLPSPGQGPPDPNQPQPPPPVDISAHILFNARGGAGSPRLHGREVDAVISALRGAYELLPRKELVQSLQSEDRLERVAALAAGGARLPADQIPLLLIATQSEDVAVQQAAIAALGQLGTPAAIARLAELVRTGTDASRQAAIASLASSRYAASHEAVLRLLRSESPEIRKAIVRGLAQFPRPLWSQAIYDFVQIGPEGMNVEAVNALVQVGHPRLLEVLSRALADSNQELQLQALTVLVRRPDRASEQLALDYTLKHLVDKDPQGPMQELLNRVKDPRSLPLLQNRFDASQQKSSLIQTLALLGDAETAQFLRDKYDALPTHEKAAVLQGMTRLAPRMFRELAEAALLSSDASLISQALQGLNEDGGPEVVDLLLKALEQSKEPNSWQQLIYALANTGSSKARAALQKLRNSPDENRRNVATNALQNMRYRSPGFHYYNMAQSLVREKKYKEAVEQFGQCLTMDPEFSDALAERGLAQMHLEKYADAGADFHKCLELDPANHLALTGECLTLILADGKWEEAIRKLEAGREQHAANLIFQYNSACVYGRVIERLTKEPETPARNEQLTKFRQQAFADLKKSLELGFRDLELMKADPDLASLRGSAEWEAVLNTAPANPGPPGPGGRRPAAVPKK